MVDVPGLPARRAALAMLDAVLRRGETLDQAAGPALRKLDGEADRALARAIATEALRWKVDLDALIDSATSKRLPDDAKPRAVLEAMLAQWLRLDTPPHAVIATGLPLLAGGPRRLAHGVFSTLAKRAKAPLPFRGGAGGGGRPHAPRPDDTPHPNPSPEGEGLARTVLLPAAPTLPEPVRRRWGERADAIARGLAEPPPLDLTLRDSGEAGHWAERLGGISLMPGHVRLPRGAAIGTLAGYAEGAWWVQDLAASLPARLLGPGANESGGKRALDLCAAPGGKTLQLASTGWRVTALDASAKRLELLRENLARTGLAADLVQADALDWAPGAPFDAVLLDAPCTATGTCRRHPDVLHRIGARQIAEMARLQARLLERASAWLEPGGRLVYAVCSLEREEGEEQVTGLALAAHPITADELPRGLSPTPEGWLRTDPGMLLEAGGLDGFFIARWIRNDT